MRRSLLAPLIIALALVASLGSVNAFGLAGGSERIQDSAPTVADTAFAPTGDDTDAEVAGEAAQAAPAPTPVGQGALDVARIVVADPNVDVYVDRPHREITLGCALVRPSDEAPTDVLAIAPDVAPAVACRWSDVDVDGLRGYQLWRAVDAPGGDARRLIATVPAGEPRRHVDRDVSPGHRYTYAVVAIATDGSKIAVSGPVTVRIPPRTEEIRLACELGSIGDERGVVCTWSEARHPHAAGYVLWRSVDGGAREAIHKVGLDGRRGHVDAEIKPGLTIRYWVTVVDRAGERVGHGGPVTVRIPPRTEEIRLACELGSIGDERGVVCTWSEARHPHAAGYVLWRSVDGGAREAIHKVGLDGRRGHVDAEIKPGLTIRYWVTVVDRAGERVGHGGPVTVRIPRPNTDLQR